MVRARLVLSEVEVVVTAPPAFADWRGVSAGPKPGMLWSIADGQFSGHWQAEKLQSAILE